MFRLLIISLFLSPDALVAKLATTEGDARVAAAGELASAKLPVAELASQLKREHASKDADRRALLKKIGAEVPNAKGVFAAQPPPKKGQPAELDWLPALATLPGNDVALLDSIEVVALLRALGASGKEEAADAILDFAFTADGLVYRDECGRVLRKMSPASLPTFLRASQNRKRDDGAFARYASYQLDRMGKNVPTYALAAAPNDDWEVAMIHALRDVKHPDAVTAILDRTDAPSHVVRKAAREAWLGYVTGPAPPPAPKAVRKLPGGKTSPKAMPLYLTYRELAENELRRVLQVMTGNPESEKADAETMTTKLFALYDQRRAELWDLQMKEAADLLAKNQLEAAAAKYDAILMNDPTYVRRSDMVAGYLSLGRAQLQNKAWDAAVATFHKALSADPGGARAKEAEAGLFLARGARARAQGQAVQGADDVARAQATSPGAVPPPAPPTTQAGPDQPAPARRPRWLLFAGIGGGGLGLLMLLVGLLRRRP